MGLQIMKKTIFSKNITSLILLFLMVLLNIWLSLVYSTTIPRPQYDSEQYFVMAYNMAKYGVSSVSTEDDSGVKPDSFREPVPSFILSIPLRAMDLNQHKLSCFIGEKTVCAELLKKVGMVNIVIVALIIISLYIAIYFVTSSHLWAIAAATLGATSSIMPSLTRVFTSELTAALFLLWHSILLYCMFNTRYRYISAIGSGVFLALLILSKAIYLYWGLCLIVALSMAMFMNGRLRSLEKILLILALVIPATSGVGAWMARNFEQFGTINVADRSISVLAIRAGYTTISWKQYFSGYLYFTPYIGFDFARQVDDDLAGKTFDDNGAAGPGRQIEAGLPTTLNSSYDEQLLEIVGLMIKNWDKQLALVPLMIYRGMFIGGCCSNPGSDVPIYWATQKVWKWIWPVQVFLTLLLVPAMLWLSVRVARKRNWVFLAFCGPVLFHFMIYGFATQFLARYSLVVYPALITIFFLLLHSLFDNESSRLSSANEAS